ncbi:MAG: GNAT family N-acetyltransferase [Dialister sp.]|nr:GNAT family N-acetyltransferase [Dialister sp.]
MIFHDEKNHTFKLAAPEGEAYLEYSRNGNAVTALHTVVPDAMSGKGIAGELTEAFYQWVSDNRFILKSECSYVSAWLKRNKKTL